MNPAEWAEENSINHTVSEMDCATTTRRNTMKIELSADEENATEAAMAYCLTRRETT